MRHRFFFSFLLSWCERVLFQRVPPRGFPLARALPLMPGDLFPPFVLKEQVFQRVSPERSFCLHGLAPHAGAGTYFLCEKKGSKDSPRGEFRFSPLEPPLNDQRRCLWKLREAPALVLLHAQARLRVKRVRRGSLSARKKYKELPGGYGIVQNSRQAALCEPTRAL